MSDSSNSSKKDEVRKDNTPTEREEVPTSEEDPKSKTLDRKAKKTSRLMDMEERLATKIPREFHDFVLENPIGIGGMGVVYKAKQKSLDRMAAVKMLPPTYNGEILDRFLQEAKLAARLNHPNIIQIISQGVVEDHPYFAMEYVDGFGLEEAIPRFKDLKFEKARHIIRQVALALSCAHREGVIHRDIKASNIMINEWGDVKVMDFGLAKATQEMNHITQTGVILGTPSYMAPEQFSGKEIDHRVDIYSLGILFFELVTGRVPFKGDTNMIILYKHMNESPNRPSLYNPQIPLSLERIILKCLEKDPNDRYQKAEDVVKALDAADLMPSDQRGSKPLESFEPRIALEETAALSVPDGSFESPHPQNLSHGHAGDNLFLELYGEERSSRKIPQAPFVDHLIQALLYELYHNHRKSQLTFKVMDEYFHDSQGIPELSEERNEVFDYLCRISDKNIVMFLDFLKNKTADLFSSNQNQLIETMLKKEGL